MVLIRSKWLKGTDLDFCCYYYAFGWTMPSRRLNPEAYTYGFNGQLTDAEWMGGQSVAFEFRTQDPRLGRFLSTDPLTAMTPWETPYAFAGNSPIASIDYLGLHREDGKQGSALEALPPVSAEPASSGIAPGDIISFGRMAGSVQDAKDPPPNYELDPKLNYHKLISNPNYEGITVEELRDEIRRDYPDIEDWKVKISAGRLLENAYRDFSGLDKGKKKDTYIKDAAPPWSFNSKVIPDFTHSTAVAVPGDMPFLDDTYYAYPDGGVVEVKVSQNEVTLEMNKYQIDGEISIASYSVNAEFPHHSANKYIAGSFTLVLPYDGFYNKKITDKTIEKKVHFYVSYAFRNIHTGKIVFSNPMSKNSFSKSKKFGSGSNFNAKIGSGVLLDTGEAAGFWVKP
jgi:RHS repeat-associated protein